jgi:hypothetical protein
MPSAIVLAATILLDLAMRPQGQAFFVATHCPAAIAAIHDDRILRQLQHTTCRIHRGYHDSCILHAVTYCEILLTSYR